MTEDDPRRQLGRRLRDLRLAGGLSQRALGELAEVSFTHLSKVEAGREPPSPELLIRLAHALGADADELLLLAGRLPSDVQGLVADKQQRALLLLRKWSTGEITDGQVDQLIDGSPGGQG